MAEKHWYQKCSINMPLTPAAQIIVAHRAEAITDTGDRAAFLAKMDKIAPREIVTATLADYGLVGPNINEKTDTLELYSLKQDDSWEDHPTMTEPPSQYGIEDLLALWAPICADGMFMELITENLDIDTGYFRLIISGGRVIHDFPRLTWDDPLVMAKQARDRSTADTNTS